MVENAHKRRCRGRVGNLKSPRASPNKGGEGGIDFLVDADFNFDCVDLSDPESAGSGTGAGNEVGKVLFPLIECGV